MLNTLEQNPLKNPSKEHPKIPKNKYHCSRDNFIITHSGKQFYPGNPRPQDFDIVDIAHALSLICRWTGHSDYFYSVAEHSIAVSYLCPPEDALEGLLHDASDAYLNDIARPVKRMVELDGYTKLERGIMDACSIAFGTDRILSSHVHDADSYCLQIEAERLMPQVITLTGGEKVPLEALFGFKAIPEEIRQKHPGFKSFAYPIEAKQMFLDRYKELFKLRAA